MHEPRRGSPSDIDDPRVWYGDFACSENPAQVRSRDLSPRTAQSLDHQRSIVGAGVAGPSREQCASRRVIVCTFRFVATRRARRAGTRATRLVECAQDTNSLFITDSRFFEEVIVKRRSVKLRRKNQAERVPRLSRLLSFFYKVSFARRDVTDELIRLLRHGNNPLSRNCFVRNVMCCRFHSSNIDTM